MQKCNLQTHCMQLAFKKCNLQTQPMQLADLTSATCIFRNATCIKKNASCNFKNARCACVSRVVRIVVCNLHAMCLQHAGADSACCRHKMHHALAASATCSKKNATCRGRACKLQPKNPICHDYFCHDLGQTFLCASVRNCVLVRAVAQARPDLWLCS